MQRCAAAMQVDDNNIRVVLSFQTGDGARDKKTSLLRRAREALAPSRNQQARGENSVVFKFIMH